MRFLSLGIFFLGILAGVHAADNRVEIPTSSATATGSNGSILSVYTGASMSGAYYINTDADNSFIGDKLDGYYYDSNYGYFNMNAFDAGSQVQFESAVEAGSLMKCRDNSLGFRLTGSAYNTNFGAVNFNYSNQIFVLYCPDIDELAGYAYSENIGFQRFDGLRLGLKKIATPLASVAPAIFDTDFINFSTTVTNSVSNNPTNPNSTGSLQNSVQGDIIGFEPGAEDVFYLVK